MCACVLSLNLAFLLLQTRYMQPSRFAGLVRLRSSAPQRRCECGSATTNPNISLFAPLAQPQTPNSNLKPEKPLNSKNPSTRPGLHQYSLRTRHLRLASGRELRFSDDTYMPTLMLFITAAYIHAYMHTYVHTYMYTCKGFRT